jgi:hypothetical protein
VGRLGIHATSAAAGAELTDLAGEGEELLAAAVGAVDAGEAVRRISAARKGGQLPLHEGRVVPATLLAGGPEGRSVALQDPVQDGTAWIAAKDRAAGSLGLELAYGDHAYEVARRPGVFRIFLRLGPRSPNTLNTSARPWPVRSSQERVDSAFRSKQRIASVLQIRNEFLFCNPCHCHAY